MRLSSSFCMDVYGLLFYFFLVLQVMVADAFDRQIHNKNLPEAQRGWAANTSNLNDSDPDLVEFDGQVLFVGNWGDQRTTPTNSLYLASYNGTMAQFWSSLYPTYSAQ